MIKEFKPKYYVYYVDDWNQKGLMEFTTKGEMNLWIKLHGEKCSYLKSISGFTLDKRKRGEVRDEIRRIY
jgi:hypothetical protein